MPNTCCVPGCHSGYKGTVEKVSLFCLPANAEQRVRWKRAIPRQETAGFSFESKYARVCEKHFDASDIVRADVCTVNGDIVSLPRERPRLVEDAVPRIFEGLPSYLSKPKQRSRATKGPPLKRPRELSPDCDATVANADVSSAADKEIEDVVRTENRNGYADAECQTEVTVCSASELQRVKAQLRSVKQQLQSCQRKLTKAEAHANRKNGVYADIHKLSDREKLIIDQCIMKANMKSAKAARYKKEWLYDCLLLKIKSTAVYTFLHENNFLPLPHPRTLYSYLKNLKAGFGFDENLFDILKDKVEKIPKRERRGVLMFDEMSVRKSLHVRESDMALLGKVDLAEHTKPTDQVKDGDHVLVFLFRPFLGGWSQTVGAFCTSGAAPGSTVAKLILQCIVLLSNAGVIVEAVTCDNSTSNRSALNSLGVSGDVTRVSTSFEHPCDSSKVIQAIIDPPHIFKCIRNNLLKAGKFLLPGDKEVQHSHFEALLDYEEQQAGLRAVPKLTKAHISPNAFQKLSVRLAVQLFSESTASAMDFYRSREECVKLRGSKATSDFARRMNSLFDCFNSKRPQDVQYNEAEHISVSPNISNLLSHPLKFHLNQIVFQTLKENIEWLDRWHTYNQSLPKQKQLFFLSKPTCNALRMTLHSTVTLVEKLLNCGFRYVLVGNFGQDHLERFFGIARHVAGAGGQPTVQQFLFIYRLLSVNNLIRPPQRASVEGDGPRLLLKMQDLFQHKEPTVNQLCAAEPACDLNGNPLFKLRCHSWQLDPPRVPPLTAFTRNRVLSKFHKNPTRLEPLSAVREPSEQAQSSHMTEQDWQYVVHAGRRKHFTWETVGSVRSLLEHPFVTEAGEREWEAVCQHRMLSLAALTGVQSSAPLGHQELVHKALLLLAGVPSDIFRYDPVPRTFSIQERARLKGTSSEALSASLSNFLECGRDIRFLEDLTSSNAKPGLTWQAFVGALKHFLHYFHGCLMPLEGRADTLTILQLTRIVSTLCNNVRCIADICRSALELQRVASPRQQSMLLLRHLCQCARSCWGREALSLVAFLLRRSCQPYFRFLEEWLYNGCCNDPYEEFPFVIHKQDVEMRDERFWEKGFQYVASEAPFLAPFMQHVFTSAKSAMLLKVCKPQSGLLWSKQLRPKLKLSFNSWQLAQAMELSEHYSRLMESELQLPPLPEFRLGLDPHVHIPEEWIEAQKELVDRQGRLLHSIPRSPSSASMCLMASSQSAPLPFQAAAAAESHEALLYSVMTGTHMKVSGCIATETGQSNHNLGLFCETAGTYSRSAQRNLFGHASDSQLGDILYPKKSKGTLYTTVKNAENSKVVTDNPTISSPISSEAETGETSMPSKRRAKTCSLEKDCWGSEGLLHQSCGDSTGLLLSKPMEDEPQGTQHGGGDASLLPADTTDSLFSSRMTAEPGALSRLAFFSHTTGECSADGGLPLDIAIKRSLLPPLISHHTIHSSPQHWTVQLCWFQKKNGWQ
ncbi:gamma-tubulin complex component 6 isoform X6 [Rhipicephalus microplus]|uniref:gamma-tubulin complex component 6 isoform X6 n=1 Tax=Rhipicephalus microplus TaxID=6941 RepID=UPI003F6D0348